MLWPVEKEVSSLLRMVEKTEWGVEWCRVKAEGATDIGQGMVRRKIILADTEYMTNR